MWRRKYQSYSPSVGRLVTGGKERLGSERDDAIAGEKRHGVHAGPSAATRGGGLISSRNIIYSHFSMGRLIFKQLGILWGGKDMTWAGAGVATCYLGLTTTTWQQKKNLKH